ncbi:TIGR01777 family protein [Shewanella sp. WXL01]|uniref:TIGR01777 family oxidoreductase n=1 Tax=Shewanella sp. WXL01 TaxID=2709721 RepID=UPI00143849A2|nr:TIGR01777 family oxidoreductase [Shewanella sp. WXL01]NKF50241.1 TIGR01777 family protein [Shewanella sp. WXL01]
MKILITGATGFVGKELVSALIGHQLVILTRDARRAATTLGTQHEYVESLIELNDLNHIDAVINLAGEPIVGKRWSDKQKQVICDSRWNITSALTQLVNQSSQPPHTFISASAIGFYGRQGMTQVTEDSPVHEEFSHHVCKEWERLALEAQSEQTRVCITRIGLVLGADGGALEKMLLPFKLGLGGPIGDGKQGFSWIHIDDLIGLLKFLLENSQTQGVFNAVSPNPISQKDFATALGKALHRPALIPTPALALRLAMGEMSDLLTQGQYVVPNHALASGYHFEYSDINQALNQILNH